MRNRVHLTLLALSLFGLTARAGGIAFEEKYVGKHPFTGKRIELQIKDGVVSYTAEDSIAAFEGLTLEAVYRDTQHNLEAIYEIRTKATEDEKSRVVARIVTTGDCQVVQNLALIYRSGVAAPLKAVARK